MNYTYAQQCRKQRNKAFLVTNPVSIKQSDSVQAVLRAKLKIGAPNDTYEQEADKVSEQVMRMPEPHNTSNKETIQRACTTCEEDKNLLQTKTNGDVSPEVTPAISSRIQSLQGEGQPLSRSERNFFEPRFGADFSAVRVHSDSRAAKVARSVCARAFTLGQNVVFGTGEYSPDSLSGRKLLAHELTHVVQQTRDNSAYSSVANKSESIKSNAQELGFLSPEPQLVQNGTSNSTIYRAEVEDQNSVCSSLTDIKSDVNIFVNQVLTAARSSPGTSSLLPFFQEVLLQTGGSGVVGPIEEFVARLPTSKRFVPTTSLAGTRFASLPNASGLTIWRFMGQNAYNLHSSGLAHVVGATALIDGICAGADKLGHFFQQGYQYLNIQLRTSLADAESFGRATEIDRAGLGATGVFSNADLAANRSGLQFWEQLLTDPTHLRFDIANFISNDWNEQSNPNFYESSVAREIWSTQLTGRWQGVFGLGPAMKNIDVALSATNTDKVTGTFEYRSPTHVTSVTGTINGTITYQRTSVSGAISSVVIHGSSGSHSSNPVSGIEIAFDWASGSNSGKGTWGSIGERMLKGEFGNGVSRSDGGVFNIVRI